jgi:hypothetical protein
MSITTGTTAARKRGWAVRVGLVSRDRVNTAPPAALPAAVAAQKRDSGERLVAL